jgi:hypothetical protein
LNLSEKLDVVYWLIFTTSFGRWQCQQTGIFCLKYEYKSEIAEVKVGDQVVVIVMSTRSHKRIEGLYTVTEGHRRTL